MVGNYVVGSFERTFGIGVGNVGNRLDQIAEKVDVKVGMHALQNGGNAFQPHAGIDGGLFQVDAAAVGQVFKLVENQVPDFDEAVAVFFRGAGQAAPDFRPVVVKDFRTGAAGAGVTHLPEVVFGGNADDSVIRQAGNLFPQRVGFFVVMINGYRQPVCRQVEIFGQKLPGIADGAFFKIVAEREVAEHFKESVVADVVADTVEVVVFAAGTHAFLRRGGAGIIPGFVAGKNVFKLHHARVGKHQGRVVVGHERG